MTCRQLRVRLEAWPLKAPFAISRYTQHNAEVVVVEIEEHGIIGRGECERADAFEPHLPNAVEAIERVRVPIEQGMAREALREIMPAGPARAAVDCALWDLEAKIAGRPVWKLAGLSEPRPVQTAFTIGLGAPESMALAALANRDRPLLKLKLGGDGDDERVLAVREAAPTAWLIADANEAWSRRHLDRYLPVLLDSRVELLEQPVPSGSDEVLQDYAGSIAFYADESCLDRTSLRFVQNYYDGINVKLDKAGGLTEALALIAEARELGLEIMVGSMVASSLSIAPALLLAADAQYVDIDSPLLLARDREHGLQVTHSTIEPPSPLLWG